MVFVISESNSILNNFLYELREVDIQRDTMRFRKNMERVGEIMAYEISKRLQYKDQPVQTQLGRLSIPLLKSQPILITILRAGIPFFNGFVNFFDKADCGFIGAQREESEHEVKINLAYVSTNSLENRTIVLIDPMLATGQSIMNSIDALLKNGTPGHIHIASLVAAPEGIEHVKTNLKIPFTLWTAAIDSKLDERFYIVPGLGDAGDLSYGIKI